MNRYTKKCPLYVGLELETCVIDKNTGKAILNFNNSPTFNLLNSHLIQQGFCSLQSEFDASSIELSTPPMLNHNEAFSFLLATLKTANAFLNQINYGLLLLGLHPGRQRGKLKVTKSSRAKKSKPLIAENGIASFATSFQVSLSSQIPENLLMPLCHQLQQWMWPLAISCQSSSIFDERNTNYQCFRTRLNDAESYSRCGPLPESIQTYQQLMHYNNALPGEKNLKRKNNTWFDILPKPLAGGGYRIEIRLADTSSITAMRSFSQAITITYQALVKALLEKKPPGLLPQHCQRINRDYVNKSGRHAFLFVDNIHQVSVDDFYDNYWRQLVDNETNHINSLIDHLLQPTRAEKMVSLLNQYKGDGLAKHFYLEDEANLLNTSIYHNEAC